MGIEAAREGKGRGLGSCLDWMDGWMDDRRDLDGRTSTSSTVIAIYLSLSIGR